MYFMKSVHKIEYKNNVLYKIELFRNRMCFLDK